LVGFGRADLSHEQFRDKCSEDVKLFATGQVDPDLWHWFVRRMYYVRGDFNEAGAFQNLARVLDDVNQEHGTRGNCLYYLATAPAFFSTCIHHLGEIGLTSEQDGRWRRVIVEKPFGRDFESARALNTDIRQVLAESQIYRIDHYLGKETVQNILAFRFSNGIFEPIWNRNYIDNIQITAAETVGVEDRGDYYEQAGALRDMVQNHILQLLCMIAMEAPVSFDANEIRNKKVDVLNAIRKFTTEDVHAHAVRGQYSGGWMRSEKVVSYRQEKNVDKNSPVETFAAVKFFVDHWRWQNVPFYVRTGKYLHEKTTLITVQFKPAPDYAFPEEASDTWRANRLTISIQPDMDIRLRFQAKRPGPSMILSPVDMVFNYAEAYHEEEPEAYETLLQDVMEGDPTLFMRADQVEAAWRVITPIMDAWEHRKPVDFPNYAPGSWGPEDAEALVAKYGHHWVTLPTKEKE